MNKLDNAKKVSKNWAGMSERKLRTGLVLDTEILDLCGFNQNGASRMLPSLPGWKWKWAKMMERMVCTVHIQENISLWKGMDVMTFLTPIFSVPTSFQDH